MQTEKYMHTHCDRAYKHIKSVKSKPQLPMWDPALWLCGFVALWLYATTVTEFLYLGVAGQGLTLLLLLANLRHGTNKQGSWIINA